MSEISSSQKITVMGVGTGGCRIAAELASTHLGANSKIILVDTDEKALRSYPEFDKLVIGGDWTDRQGCGGDMVRGEKATGSSTEALTQKMVGSEMVIIIAPLGGGTGSGAAPLIAGLARSLKILSMSFVTRPFTFEGNTRSNNSEKSYGKLLKYADAVVCIDNDILFQNLSGNISSDFKSADRAIADCISGVLEMILSDGLIKIDFTHIKQLLRQKEADCHVGVGQGFGEERLSMAIESLLSSPTLGGSEVLNKCDAAIVNLLAGKDLSMEMINGCMAKIKELFAEKAVVDIGVSTTSEKQSFLQITVLTICHSQKPIIQEDVQVKTVKSTKKNQARKKDESVYNIQGELPLQDVNSGVFEKLTPTYYSGQNLDIPTFLRMELTLDLGSN